MATSCNASESKVTLKNLDAFKQSMRNDLPIGSSREDIENYLKRNKIRYGYYERDKTYHAGIPNIGRWRIIYTAHLSIYLRLDDAEERLKQIDFDVQYSGL